MKNILIVMIMVLFVYQSYSKPNNKIIKVSRDIEIEKLSDNLYLHVTYDSIPNYGRMSANGLIYINNNEAYIIDSPWNNDLTKDLYTWLTQKMKLNIVGFIPTHWHSDCMGGLEFLQSQNIPTYANQKTIEIAKNKQLAIPNHGFQDSLLLKLGDKSINSYYLGAAHTIDNIVVFLPTENVLFAGCMIKSLDFKNLGNTTESDLIAYPKTLDLLIPKFKNTKIVIPGHGKIGGLELIKHTKKLTKQYQK